MQNTNENVRIRITGELADIENFLRSVSAEAPPASMIEHVSVDDLEFESFTGFTIHHSHNVSDEVTEISPDIAVCDECMEDVSREGNRRNYAFVNCTNCGPRFTIIRDLPYDRAKTTMEPFTMCPECRREYDSILDRRFHAQPVACSTCGPKYELHIRGNAVVEPIEEIIERTSVILDTGGCLLIKGLGGMHLACDAFDDQAVAKLREIKKRDGKPFAVMFRDLETLKKHALLDPHEERSILSWRRPIVLLSMKDNQNSRLPQNINSGLGLLGVMLPYLPFHYLLFQQMTTDAIVLTSGNFSSEPILIDNQAAISWFSDKVDALVLHNRDIFNRTDDSVVRIMGGKERIFRRSRGYVPTPVRTAADVDGIIAFGAELTNCFCLGKGKKALLSQHIGDLQGLETADFYEETLGKHLQLFRVVPSMLAVDLHPDYISTRSARQFGDLPGVKVQHHHAHIASCMAEHHLDEKVIGVSLDGTGYGDDGNIWGGEFLLCDLNDYKRMTHFDYIPLPGGDSAAEEPWRMAVSWLYRVFGKDFLMLELPFLRDLDLEKAGLVMTMIDRKINCPLTSGAGRLFDAVASMLGLCQVATFHAEGPMRLESLARENCGEAYRFGIGQTIRFDDAIRAIADDLLKGVKIEIIASKFHNTVISAIFEAVLAIRREEGINKVVLSGGVFQNKYLLEGTIALLKENNFDVYAHETVPTNDGGISLGQLAVAAKRRSLKCV